MKLAIPEISWHNRDPVLSVDFQPKSEPNDPLRLATGGTDSHVLVSGSVFLNNMHFTQYTLDHPVKETIFMFLTSGFLR